jgi:GT2 family glycosyltransferase
VLEEPVNTGFAPAVARGTRETAGDWIALVNNDADVAPDCFARMLEAGERAADVGSVAAQIRFTERPDVLNSAGLEVDRLGIAWERLAGAPASEGDSASRDVFGATGCVALYRRAALEAVGGFDPAFFAYLEDVDVAWRLRAAGWRTVYEPAAVAHHRGSATSREGSAFKYGLVGRNRMRLLAKNASGAQLARYGAGMLAFDLAYVLFAGLTDRTAAPLQGRLRGLRAWRQARALGAATRGPAPLAPAGAGWSGALGQWRGYRRGGTR